jgi:DNA-binding response OmpR family regulator
MKNTIAYVDDDFENLSFYKEMLSEDFELEVFSRSLDFMEALKEKNYCCFILDIYMPVLDGFRMLEKIRERPELNHTPVFFITSHPHDELKILSYNSGATDFVDRMVKKEEFVARLRSKIKAHRETNNFLRMENLHIDLQRINCVLNDEKIILTITEFKLLAKLMKNFPYKISKEELVKSVWGNDQLSANNLNTHLYNLRMKVADWCYTIENHRQEGFFLKRI